MRKGYLVAGIGIAAIGIPAWKKLGDMGMDVTAIYQWKNAYLFLFSRFDMETLGSVLMMSVLWASLTAVAGLLSFLLGLRPEKPPVPEVKYDANRARLFARKMKSTKWSEAELEATRMEGPPPVEMELGADGDEIDAKDDAMAPPRPAKVSGVPEMTGAPRRTANFMAGIIRGGGGLLSVASRHLMPHVQEWLEVARARFAELRGHKSSVVRDLSVPAAARRKDEDDRSYAENVISWYAAYRKNRDMDAKPGLEALGRQLAAELSEVRRELLLSNYSLQGFAALSAVTALSPVTDGVARQPQIEEFVEGKRTPAAQPMEQPDIEELLERANATRLEDDEADDTPSGKESIEEAIEENPFASPAPASDKADEPDALPEKPRNGLFAGIVEDQADEDDPSVEVRTIRVASSDDDVDDYGSDGEAFSSGLLGVDNDEGSGMDLSGLVDEGEVLSSPDEEDEEDSAAAGTATDDRETEGPVEFLDDIEEDAARARQAGPDDAERIYHEDHAARHIVDSIYAQRDKTAPVEMGAEEQHEESAQEHDDIEEEAPAVPHPAEIDDAPVVEGRDSEYDKLAERWLSTEDDDESPAEISLPDDANEHWSHASEQSGVSDEEMDKALASIDKTRLAAIIGEKSGSPAWVARKLAEYGLEDLTDRSSLIPVLWEQLDKAVDYQTRAFAWENFGEEPPAGLSTAEERERYLIMVATSIVALREQVAPDTLRQISDIKEGSEEIAWLNGRAERMLAALGSPENRARLKNLVNGNGETGVLRPLHEARSFTHMAARGEPDSYRFRDVAYEESWKAISPVAKDYRAVVDKDIKVFRSVHLDGDAIPTDDMAVIDIVVGNPKEHEGSIVGICFVVVPTGSWRLVPNELGGKDEWLLMGEAENDGSAVRVRDHCLGLFQKWAAARNKAAHGLIHFILTAGATIEGLEDITEPEFRTRAWTPDEWSVVKRFHLSKTA